MSESRVVAAAVEGTTDAAPPVVSKNQLKKKRRMERCQQVNKRRKQQEKEARLALAKAQGRDVEKERLLMAERTRLGDGKRRRVERWRREKLPLAQTSFQVALDCIFEKDMSPKEIISLALQIRYCYGNNRRNQHPCLLAATSVGGATLAQLQNVNGFAEWTNWAFTAANESLEQHYGNDVLQKNGVYLTSDSANILHQLDDSKIYIIGGIVDRNRLKGTTLERAQQLGIPTARLPLDDYIRFSESTRVLTCNHVFDILLRCRENGGDWKKAFTDVLPQRKEISYVGECDREGDGQEG